MATATDTQIEKKLKTPSLWHVVFHNDDFTPMDFVTQVLMEVLHKTEDEAYAIMLKVHHEGKATAAVYTKEIAQTKASEVMKLAQHFQHPLRVTADEG